MSDLQVRPGESVSPENYVTAFPDQSVLGTLIDYRQENNRDLKIIITSKSSTTGLGKTTLAVHLARFADRSSWNAEDKAFVNVKKYVEAYREASSGDCLILDEAEYGADSRRAMSQDNVDLSHAFATLRYKNVTSILTLPTISMLDNRLLELSDVWINCIRRGFAQSYAIMTNDYSGHTYRSRLRDRYGGVEALTWTALDGDEDFEELADMKASRVEGIGEELYTEGDIEPLIEDAKKEAVRDAAYEIYTNDRFDLHQDEVGELFGFSQQWVSRVVNEEEE